MKMKKLVSLGLAATMALSLAACGGSSSTAETAAATEAASEAASGEAAAVTSSRDTLVLAISADPGNLRADTLTSLNCLVYDTLFYDFLFYLGDDGTYQNAICEDYTLDDDNKGVTLKIREGVKFHDGNTMTASDVLFSLENAQEESAYSSTLAFIDSAASEATDDNTLHLQFTEVNAAWQNPLASMGLFEQSAFEAAGSSEAFWQDPMTASPYILDEWVSGDHLTLTAFADYWAGAPLINTITLRVLSESSVALMELQTGGVDINYNMSKENYDSAMEDTSMTSYEGSGIASVYIGMNDSHEALSNLKVRQAIVTAIDFDTLVEGAYDGAGTMMYSIIGEHALGYDNSYETAYPYAYDPDAAKALLEEAGYGDGLTLTMIVDETPARQLIAEQLYNMLGAIGITLDIQQVDFASATDILNNTDNYDMYIRGAAVNSGDAIAVLDNSGVFGLCKFENDANVSEWNDLVGQIYAEMDADARADLYGQLQSTFWNDLVYWIPCITPNAYTAYTSALQGVEVIGGTWHWNNAYFQ